MSTGEMRLLPLSPVDTLRMEIPESRHISCEET